MKLNTVLFGLITLLACNAYAGVTEGKVGYVFVNTGNDTVSFGMQSSDPKFSSCATSSLYILSTGTQQGKNIYSAVLAAKASGQSIQVVGKNTCVLQSNAEDINYIALL